MPTLYFTQPEFGRQRLELPDGTFSVGRSTRNQILIEDASVSKEHAELLIYGTEVILRERGSRNGSFVDGVRIQAQSGVRHGQRIRFGRVELRLDLGDVVFEESTNITAVPILVWSPATTGKIAPPPSRFPLRFAPAAVEPDGQSTFSLPSPEPTAAVPQPPATPSSRPWSAWFGRILGAGTLFLIVFLLWKR